MYAERERQDESGGARRGEGKSQSSKREKFKAEILTLTLVQSHVCMCVVE